jgi:hypothetical protein
MPSVLTPSRNGRRIVMPTHRVNLDALIKRQDFERGIVSTIQGENPVFKLDELESRKTFYSLLRKPDFQRTTNNWSPEMIVEFVRTFLDKELIPAIIVWHSQETEKIYLIDGAHRVSALIAWVNDDYGDGPISRKFFGDGIPDLQRKLHNKTRQLMNEKIGSYADLVQKAANNPDDDTDISVRRGRVITTNSPPLQRVQGDAETAEKAFLRINESPAIIDPTELDIIKARRKPNTIATRALMQAGKGYQYWARFKTNAPKISALAAEVYDLLFGEIVEISTQSPDVPRAGQPYSAVAFKMVLDMVNIFNDVSPVMWQESKSRTKAAKSSSPMLDDDPDGSVTLTYLEKVKKVGRFVFDPSLSGALGLDPAVYCYGPEKLYPAAYLAALKFAMELKDNDALFAFTELRHDFEEFIVRHKSFIKQISGAKGSRTRPLESLMTMHRVVLECLLDSRRANEQVTDEQIIAKLLEQPALRTTIKTIEPIPAPEEVPKKKRRSFPKSEQQAAVLLAILNTRERCTECKARLAPFSRSKDHIVPKEEGGMGTLDNLQFTHPYCNSGYKEAKRAKAKKAAGTGTDEEGNTAPLLNLFES